MNCTRTGFPAGWERMPRPAPRRRSSYGRRCPNLRNTGRAFLDGRPSNAANIRARGVDILGRADHQRRIGRDIAQRAIRPKRRMRLIRRADVVRHHMGRAVECAQVASFEHDLVGGLRRAHVLRAGRYVPGRAATFSKTPSIAGPPVRHPIRFPPPHRQNRPCAGHARPEYSDGGFVDIENFRTRPIVTLPARTNHAPCSIPGRRTCCI